MKLHKAKPNDGKKISNWDDDYGDIAITLQLCHLCTITLNYFCFV